MDTWVGIPFRSSAWLLAAVLLGPRPAGAQSPGRDLAGRWTVTLMIDSITPATTARTVTGSLVAVPVRGVTPATWRGSYQIPFSTAGLGPDGAPLLARRLRSDSIRIILNPDVSHGHAELVGGWRGGLLEGSWRWIGDPARAAGRFSLRPEGR